jgi:hypothetical protein
MTQLRQRISMLIRLRPLGLAEVSGYVEHRLRVAGYEGPPLFSGGALSTVASLSAGIPRNINNICFNALSLGYASGQKVIDSETVREVAVDLDLRSFVAEPAVSPPAIQVEPDSPPSLHQRRSCRSDGWAILLDRISAPVAQPYSFTRMETEVRPSMSTETGSNLIEGLGRDAERRNLRLVN